MFVKITNGNPEIYTIGQLRRDNPNVSFPRNISNETLARYKVYPYYLGEKPQADPLTTVIKEGKFERDDNAKWFLSYVAEQLPQDKAEEVVRNKRNMLLAETDWTQINDAPVDQAAWATYRQELRDITSQEGFPFNVIWPVRPE